MILAVNRKLWAISLPWKRVFWSSWIFACVQTSPISFFARGNKGNRRRLHAGNVDIEWAQILLQNCEKLQNTKIKRGLPVRWSLIWVLWVIGRERRSHVRKRTSPGRSVFNRCEHLHPSMGGWITHGWAHDSFAPDQWLTEPKSNFTLQVSLV